VDIVFANAGISLGLDYFEDKLDEDGELMEMGIPVIDVNLKSVAASKFSVCLLVLLARLVDLSCYCVACFPLFLGTNNLAASKLALHYFKKNNPPGGSLVLTCSTAGYNARPNIVLYSAAKHGVCPTNPSKCSLNKL
jgi:NAD(P)-dependent dehydrogenase (short-subunit alcohol dehydrogenase family)